MVQSQLNMSLLIEGAPRLLVSYSEGLKQALKLAKERALKFGHYYIGTASLLLR